MRIFSMFVSIFFMMISLAYASVSAPFTATATIKKAITITQNSALNFGTIEVGSTAGTFTIAPSTIGQGNISTTGAGIYGNGAHQQGLFTLTGSNNGVVNVSIQTPSFLLDSGTDSIPVTLTVSSSTVTLSATGTAPLGVGGTLNIAASQVEGVYTGTYNIVANY